MPIPVDPSSFAVPRRSIRTAAFALLAFQLSMGIHAQGPATATSTEPFAIVIVNGHCMDGTGSPWYSADVGIRAGHIAAIGNLASAPRKQTIDAGGKVVAPGFIDMLGQSELTILVEPKVPSKIFQGITTEVTGEGNSAAPVNAAMIAADRASYEHLHIQPDWTTFREF